MKNRNLFLLVSFLCLNIFVFGQSQRNIRLLDNWTTDTLVQVITTQIKFNETWGFVQDEKEYGVIGSTEGAHFFEIKDKKLNFIDFVGGKAQNAGIFHRDYHDYKGYLYMVADEGASSLQIVDLSYLPDSVHIVYDSDTIFQRSHNVFIDTSSALLYACGASTGNAMEVYSISNPEVPVHIHSYDDVQYVHDIFVRNDTAYLNCGDSGLKIVDFSNPTTPFELASLEFYQDQGYNHSGWLSPDGKTYLFCDETNGKRIKRCDVSDLPNIEINALFGTSYLTEQIAHNVMITERFAVVSYYNEGLRIYDYTTQVPTEIAHYDTWTGPQDPYKFNGAWGIYIFNPSKYILLSDRQSGLYLFEFDYDFPEISTSAAVSVYPNPSNSTGNLTFYVDDYEAELYTFEILDNRGRIVFSESSVFNYLNASPNLHSGLYHYRVRYNNQYDEEQLHKGKISIVN